MSLLSQPSKLATKMNLTLIPIHIGIDTILNLTLIPIHIGIDTIFNLRSEDIKFISIFSYMVFIIENS